ncbi:MAG: hypothetical protein J0M04_24235 [Verrucomicrobia bacterium]|nr:hypothetical protein [Verrucomicrobiota bacterium]
MPISYQRRCLVLLAAAAVAVGFQTAAVKTGAEREIFAAVARTVANPPIFTEGDGSDEKPFGFRARAAVAEIQRAKAPVVVSIGDPPTDGLGMVFQESPPSPADIAVILSNLRKLGAKNVAVAAVLAWKEPDLINFKSLEVILGKFDMVVHAAPLARHTRVDPMPEAFERASLSPESVTGDVSRLPIINQMAVADVVFAPGKGLAGFSTLDDIKLKGRVPMLARWEEDSENRMVLAFPLLAVLARYELPLGGVKVRLGEAIELSPEGPMVPIDSDGCLALPPKPVPSRVDVSAEAMIEAKDGIFPDDPGLIVLRDDQSFAPAATRRFSRDLASVMAAIGSDGGLAPMVTYRRISGEAALALGGFLLAGMWLACGLGKFGRNVAFALLIGYVAVAQFACFGLAEAWYPGACSAVGLLAGWGMCGMLGRGRETAAPQVPAGLSPAPAAVVDPAFRRTSIRSVTIWREPAASAAAEPVMNAVETAPAPLEPLPQPEIPEIVAEPEAPEAVPEPDAGVEPIEESAAPPVVELSVPKKRATKTARPKRTAEAATATEPAPPAPPEEPIPTPPPATKRAAKRTVAKKTAPAKVEGSPAEAPPPPAKKTVRRRKAAPGAAPEAPPET